MEDGMQEFLLLICTLLFIAFLQKIAGDILDKHELKNYKPVVDIACIVTCYFLLGRYVYVHLLEDVLAFIGLVM